MKRLKCSALVVVALCLAAVAIATTAVALPTVLPSATSSRAWTGASVGEMAFQTSSTELKCVKSDRRRCRRTIGHESVRDVPY